MSGVGVQAGAAGGSTGGTVSSNAGIDAVSVSGRLRMSGEIRCGNCVTVHGRSVKRLLARHETDTGPTGHRMQCSAPDLPAAKCGDCDRTYYVEDSTHGDHACDRDP